MVAVPGPSRRVAPPQIPPTYSVSRISSRRRHRTVAMHCNLRSHFYGADSAGFGRKVPGPLLAANVEEVSMAV